MSVRAIEIGILCYPGAQMAAILGLTDLFAGANHIVATRPSAASLPLLRVCHWQQQDDHMQCVFVSDALASGAPDAPDAVLIPPSMQPPAPRPAACVEHAWLRTQQQAGAVMCPICAGAFVLGETGMLDGCEITLPWHYAEAFQARFPRVRFQTERRIIDTPALISASSAMAWTNLGLRLVARYLGMDVMQHLAHLLLIDPPYDEAEDSLTWVPASHHGDAAILKAQQWLHCAAGPAMTLTAVADAAALAPRTLLRRFQKATGMTPGRYIQQLRISRAQTLLRSTQLPLAQIAWIVGYADPGTLRRRFIETAGMPPRTYRLRFGLRTRDRNPAA